MIIKKDRARRWACAAAIGAAILLATVAPTFAQTNAGALESQRQAVFDQLFRAPADPALMMQYARLSVQLRDYEAAAATLERLLDIDPGNSDARFELAVAYFALGSHDVARYHFDLAAAAGNLPPAQLERLTDYQQINEDRDVPSTLTGSIALGGQQIDGGATDETGTIGSFGLTWRQDLGGANADYWLTEFQAAAFSGGALVNRQSVALRTGPVFRLTGTAFGPQLQPYLDFAAVRNEDGEDLNIMALGLAFRNTHSAFWSTFMDLEIGRADNTTLNEDSDFAELVIGATYRPSRDTRLRMAARASTTDGVTVDTDLIGLRLEAEHDFDVGLTGVDRRWTIAAHAQADRVEVTDTAIMPAMRDDDRQTYGLSLRAFFTDDAYVRASVAQLSRSSTNATFDLDQTVLTLQLGWEF